MAKSSVQIIKLNKGDEIMSYLTPDATYNYKTKSGDKITVKQKIIPDTAIAPKNVASWCPKGAKMKPCAKIAGTGTPRGICVHNTSNTVSKITSDTAELYTLATYPNGNMSGVVVHYYVYKKSIWQNLRLDEQGWHASDGAGRYVRTHDGKSMIGGNVDCISVEVIGSDEETNQTAAKLCAYLCNRFKLNPSKDIYTHNYFMHKKGDVIIPGASKNCPYYLLPIWKDFLADVVKYNTAKTDTRVVTAKITVPVVEASRLASELQSEGFTVTVTASE